MTLPGRLQFRKGARRLGGDQCREGHGWFFIRLARSLAKTTLVYCSADSSMARRQRITSSPVAVKTGAAFTASTRTAIFPDLDIPSLATAFANPLSVKAMWNQIRALQVAMLRCTIGSCGLPSSMKALLAQR